VIFVSGASTFNTLHVQADNGILVQTNVNTDVGNLILDGDLENSSTEDVRDGVLIKPGRTVTAKSKMTLDSTNDGITSQGAVTLRAGDGILVNDHLTGTQDMMVINADYESAGDGTLTIVSTKQLSSTNNELLITAWDIDIDGTITVGTNSVSIHGAKASQTLGLGATAKDLHLSDAEVGFITGSAGLTVGSDFSGNLNVDGMTSANTDAVGTITLMATKADKLVVFSTTASIFQKGIILQGMGGVVLSADVTTTNSETLIITATGSLTIASGKTLSTSNQLLT
jgi:hypothetical protein